jgi:hypothetical protein
MAVRIQSICFRCAVDKSCDLSNVPIINVLVALNDISPKVDNR